MNPLRYLVIPILSILAGCETVPIIHCPPTSPAVPCTASNNTMIKRVKVAHHGLLIQLQHSF